MDRRCAIVCENGARPVAGWCSSASDPQIASESELNDRARSRRGFAIFKFDRIVSVRRGGITGNAKICRLRLIHPTKRRSEGPDATHFPEQQRCLCRVGVPPSPSSSASGTWCSAALRPLVGSTSWSLMTGVLLVPRQGGVSEASLATVCQQSRGVSQRSAKPTRAPLLPGQTAAHPIG